MAESFENLDNILRFWVKDKGQKGLAAALYRFEKQEEERHSRFFQKIIQKEFSSSVSRQSSETKSNTKLVLVIRKPLLYFEFNKLNKQNFSEIILFKN